MQSFQKQVVEHKGDIERGVAVVGNLEIDHPQPVAHENVLRRVVSVDETHASRSHPPHTCIHSRADCRQTMHDRAVVRLDSELIERLEIAERVCHVKIVGRCGVHRREQIAEARRDVWIDVPFEETLLPVLPALGCRSDRQCAGVVINVEDVRHRTGRKSAGEAKRLGFSDGSLAFCHPLVVDAQTG